MKTTGRIDSSLPTAETPLSPEAIISVAPTLASEIISNSGADEEPRKMAPSTSSIRPRRRLSSRTRSAAPE